jgi:23S rRNA (uracil1939-C5)-methyltransferase
MSIDPVTLAAPLHVEKPVAGGDGFTRLPDGRPLFVAGALPGDWIVVQELTAHAGYARATRWRLTQPSSERREPACPIAGTCGGCDWMALNEAAQLAGKRAILLEALRRTAHLAEAPVELRCVTAGSPAGYRSRVRLRLDAAAGPGFFGAATHRHVPVTHCLVANQRVNLVIERLNKEWRSLRTALADYDQVEVRALGEKTELWFISDRRKRKRPRPLSAAVTRAFPPTDFVLSVATAGDGVASTQTQTLAHAKSVQLRIAPQAFTQVNWEVNQAIVRELLDGAKARGLCSFADLYCGIGNFSLPLLHAGLRGVGVEDNTRAVALAREAALSQGLTGEFVAGDVARNVEQFQQSGREFDLVVVDPPRSGATNATRAIAALAQRQLFLCACDPVTFARDLAHYLAAGFRLESLTLYDMFPQTHHFEVTAWLAAPAR